jgi:Protein of unknown function (DUF1676)
LVGIAISHPFAPQSVKSTQNFFKVFVRVESKKKMFSTKVVIFALFAVASADIGRDDIKKSCDNGYSLTCLKLDMVQLVDKITDTEKIDIITGVSVVKEPSENDTKTSEIVAGTQKKSQNSLAKRIYKTLMR